MPTDGGVPNLIIDIQNSSLLFGKSYLFSKACGVSGYLMGKPFDQPVEAIRKYVCPFR